MSVRKTTRTGDEILGRGKQTEKKKGRDPFPKTGLSLWSCPVINSTQPYRAFWSRIKSRRGADDTGGIPWGITKDKGRHIGMDLGAIGQKISGKGKKPMVQMRKL